MVCGLDTHWIETVKNTSLSRLSLRQWLWGGRVSDPPMKAGAERRKKTAFQALLSHRFPYENT